MPASSAADTYDGTIPFPDTAGGGLPVGGPVQVAVTSPGPGDARQLTR